MERNPTTKRQSLMDVKTYLVAYFCSGAAFVIGDGLWLGVIAKSFYRNQLGDLLSANPSLAAAGAFYLIFMLGLVYFAVTPALTSESWITALINGAVLGLVAYATYDLTSLAVIRNFPGAMVWVDLVWGTLLSAAAATAGFYGARVFSASVS